MTANELKLFLSEEQFVTVDSEQAKALILKHEISSVKKEELLTLAGRSEREMALLFSLAGECDNNYAPKMQLWLCRFHFVDEVI